MSTLGTWQFRVSRALGRLATRVAAALTLGRMPPFVSASAVVIRGGSILVVEDAARREPVLPGGHLRWKEDPRHAVVREVWEETGFCIEPGRVLGVFSGEEWAGERGVVRIIYQGTVLDGRLRSSSEGEARWMPFAALASSETRDAAILRHLLRENAMAESDVEP